MNNKIICKNCSHEKGNHSAFTLFCPKQRTRNGWTYKDTRFDTGDILISTTRPLELKDIEQCENIFKLNQPIEGWKDYPVENLTNELNACFQPIQFCKPKYLVTEINNEVIAFAGYGRMPIDDGLYGLFWAQVSPFWQNKGIGTALTKERLRLIKLEGGEACVATTAKGHLAKMGFKEVIDRGDKYKLMIINISK